MENASKALIIAGGVLISILVISLFMWGYNGIRNYMSVNQSLETSEQISEFNKQYDVYYRNNVNGVDLLSLINKVVDYNHKYTQEDGYTPLELSVTFSNDVIVDGVRYIEKNKSYKSEQLRTQIDDLTAKKEEVGGQKVNDISGRQVTISSLDGSITQTLKDLFGNGYDAVNDKVQAYSKLKTALSRIKNKTFKATEFQYSNVNGKITLMSFVET